MSGARRLWAALLLAVAANAAALAPPPAQRVASLNLCTDLLLLAVAAPEHIVSLTALAADPELSPMSSEARRYPANHGRAEELLPLHPDLILADASSAAASLALLRRLGMRIEVFASPTTVAGIQHNLLKLGHLLGREAVSQALAAGLPAADTALRGTAWLLQPGGHTPGESSLGPALLAAAGLRDMAPAYGLGAGGFVPLERLLSSRPDFLVTGASTPRGSSRAEEWLAHPALANAPSHRLRVAENLWSCGGVSFAEAVTTLRRAAASE